MGRWLARLSEVEKNSETPITETPKTPKTPVEPVLGVLSVPQPAEYENSQGDTAPSADTKLPAGGKLSTPRTTERFEVSPNLSLSRGSVRPPNWLPKPGPGITVLRPAVEVSAREYDAHLDTMIAALPEGSAERNRMQFAKRKGWVVDRDGERIFTRGRM